MGAVVLRDVTVADLPVFYAHQRDPESARMAAFPSRDWGAFFSHWTKILADTSVHKQTILYEGKVAGNLVCFEKDGKREVGYWIGREFWGKGIATQALAEFLKQIPTRPLFAYAAKHNVASRRVLEKSGFLLFGEDRWTPYADGEPVEDYVFILNH